MSRLIVLATMLSCISIASSAQIKSRYSPTFGDACKESLKVMEDGATKTFRECPGVANYQVEFFSGETVNLLNVVTPEGRKIGTIFPVSNAAFIRKKASSNSVSIEWRVRKKVPIALIIPAYVAEENNNNSVRVFKKYVLRLDNEKLCVTKIVGPSRNMTSVSRKAADLSAAAQCMEPK
ncbi:MAG: hypothetical protein ABL952_09860 [Pyrinomonadaceae bacterium]